MSRKICIKEYTIPLLLLVLILFTGYVSVDNSSFPLIAALLFLPFLDIHWKLPTFSVTRIKVILWLACLLVIVAIALVYQDYFYYAWIMLFLVALPEEWFFRGYLLKRLSLINNISIAQNSYLIANIFSSIAFSLLHALTRGLPVAIEVFLPSLFFGWLYQKTNDLILCIFIHTISNLMFVLFLNEKLSIVRKLLGYDIE